MRLHPQLPRQWVLQLTIRESTIFINTTTISAFKKYCSLTLCASLSEKIYSAHPIFLSFSAIVAVVKVCFEAQICLKVRYFHWKTVKIAQSPPSLLCLRRLGASTPDFHIIPTPCPWRIPGYLLEYKPPLSR